MSMWNNNINIDIAAYPFTMYPTDSTEPFSFDILNLLLHQVQLGTSNLDKRQEIKQFVK